MTAPVFRSLDQLTGARAESPVVAILEAADEISGQTAALALARADADDAAETIGLLLDERDGLACRVQELTAERDEFAEKLRELDEAHQITLGRLASVINERDAYRAVVAYAVRTHEPYGIWGGRLAVGS